MDKEQKILPDSADDLMMEIQDDNGLMDDSVKQLLRSAVDNIYQKEYSLCLSLCKPLLDKIWEELNTGYWKDVPVTWRYSYSLVSILKALCQSVLLSDSQHNIDHMSILRTCDMGLLMGAPILNNALARMSRDFQRAYGALADTGTRVKKDGKSETPDENGDKMSKKTSSVQDCHSSSTSDIPAVKKPKLTESYASPVSESEGVKMKISKRYTCDLIREERETTVIPEKIKTQTTREIPRCSCPSVEMFEALFMDNGHPVIITDSIGYWPALTSRQWSLEYLRRVAGQRTVPVELGKRYTDENWTQKLMTVNEMIDKYVEDDQSETKAYLAQHQLFDQVWELRDDISVPVYCCLGQEEEVDINAWFGPVGTISPLHYDPKHNFLCQVMGRKYVRLYSSENSESLYPHPSTLLNNTSQIDLDSPELTKFPKFAAIPCLECILQPGDMLYIPPKHWHYVKSLDISFSVSFWWS